MRGMETNMAFHAPPTALTRLSRRQARVVLVLVAVLTVGLVIVALGVPPRDPSKAGPGDVGLYKAEIERIRDGEGYYEAAGAELRPRGYPTTNLFNWRTPLPMWLIGKLPYPLGKALLIAAAAGVLILGFRLMEREAGTMAAFCCVVLLIGAMLPCVLGDLYVMPVVWAGIFLALSAAAYSNDRRGLGLGAALAALFLRDLAAPYCLYVFATTLRDRKYRELAVWFVGLAAYAAFFALHASTVSTLIRPDDITHDHGWIRLGGAAFVIGITRMNCYLLVLPLWVSALYLMAALVGLAGWNSKAGTLLGLTLAAYVAAFAIVGQPFNLYWGSLIAPLMCFGVARAPGILRDLCQAAGWRNVTSEAVTPAG